MDVLGWLWWLLASLFGLVWSLVWFLLGGWVSTLAQIAVIALVIFGYKYGWRRSPQELLARLGTFGRFAWGWLRAKEFAVPPPSRHPAGAARSRGRVFEHRQPGDVRLNVSTCLSLLMLAGLTLLAAV